MESYFTIGFSDHEVHAIVHQRHGHRSIVIHHSKSHSLTDLLLKTDGEGNPQIFATGGRLIESIRDLDHYWPTGWRCIRNIIAMIEQAMETELFFTKAIHTLT